jgi:hypothetical protein
MTSQKNESLVPGTSYRVNTKAQFPAINILNERVADQDSKD